MRFSTAWASVLTQNITLKFMTLILTIVSVALTISTVRLSYRDPLIIERACFSKVLQPASTSRTNGEIESFLKEALAMRFNANSEFNQNYFSSEEVLARASEQKELANRSMTQKVLVNSIKIDGAKVLVDCDRLVSVGNVRSVLPFTLQLNLSTDSRSQTNPYGLVINHIAVSKKEEVAK